MLLNPYMEHFNGYIELMDDDSSLFRDFPAPVPPAGEKSISSELLWCLGRHPEKDEGSCYGRIIYINRLPLHNFG